MNCSQNIKTPVVFITGPTGVGKTDFVDAIASSIPIEIINMDVGQLYEPLSIGTAKPEWKKHPVPHHLFDYCVQPVNITVSEYRKKAEELIKQIQARGNTPVFVGGSLFYLKSLFFPIYDHDTTNLVVPPLPSDPQELWNLLNTYDPVRAQAIGVNDAYRLNRAISIWYTTGKIPSSIVPLYDPIAPSLIIFLDRDRTDLYDRINLRTRKMIENGWINEIQNLNQEWKYFLCNKKLIGYNEIIANSTMDQESLIQLIQKRTRNYARRQQSFWRSFKKQLMEAQKEGTFPVEYYDVNVSVTDLNFYLTELKSMVTTMKEKLL